MSPDDHRPLASRRRVVLIGLLAALVGVILVLTTGPERLFEFSPAKRAEFEGAAAAALSHPLYIRAPGGASATARRGEALRGPIEVGRASWRERGEITGVAGSLKKKMYKGNRI